MASLNQEEAAAAAPTAVETSVLASMLAEEPLKSFWEFATTVRRTKSLADRESSRLRGTWLAPGLAVQRVHGWGLRSVRLLCVRAPSEEHCERLRIFFQHDRRNLEGHMWHVNDPLNRESRVLVKIPYDACGDAWVKHERQVLTDLAGIEGVPRLGPLLYFGDIDTHAATYEYRDVPSMQDHLEQGRLVPQERTHSILSLMLLTLARAHSRGWLHSDLSPKDVLISQTAASEEPSPPITSQGVVCGWSRAVRCSQAITPSPSIVEFVNALPVRPSEGVNSKDEGAPVDSSGSYCEADLEAFGEDSDATTKAEASAPSIYSAPEQFLALFTGTPCVSAATDVYRAAGITIMATCGNAPLGIQGKPVSSAVAPDIDSLRRFCKQAILRRSEEEGQVSLPTAGEVQSFAECLERLVNGRTNLRGCKDAVELVPWFERALTREAGVRFQTADEAMEVLDTAWSEYEARLAKEYRNKQMLLELVPPPKEVERRQRIVFARPPGLDEMLVV